MSGPVLPLQLRPDAVIVTVDQNPVILPAGMSARTACCLVCGEIAGDRSVQAVTLIPTKVGPCDCGRVMCWAFWMHAACSGLDADALLHLAGAVLLTCQERRNG